MPVPVGVPFRGLHGAPESSLPLDQRLTTIPQHQWASKLLGFDFVVEYKPGAMNVVADALSHRDEGQGELLALSAPQFSLFDDIRQEINGDIVLSQLHDAIRGGAKPEPLVCGGRPGSAQRESLCGGNIGSSPSYPGARPWRGA